MLIVGALFVLTTVFKPVYADPSPPPDGQHYPYTALWNGTQPELTDPRQKAVLNCWFAAASIATVYVSPDSIKHLFYFPNGTSMGDSPYPEPSSDNVTVTLFHPTTYQPYNFTASIWNESWTEDHPGGCWWNSALTQAAQQFSGINGTDASSDPGVVPGILANGTFDTGGGSASTGMTIFTGLPSATEYAQNYASLDDFFNDLSKSPYTPIVVGTVDDDNITTTTPPLYGDHGFPVLNTTDYGNGTRTVCLRNPWGLTDCHELSDLFANTFAVNHLLDWTNLTWPRDF